ncbi:hypothetical protein AVEN_76181-1 [Araneus ventricosus]|uniref:Uncharacterized protein n=1 Tax=Araneus ventricosus TaxID=182803 RepID=A0A4Y2EX57_ARAVE|nr:hypothetical protein AVEN_76181-1 [Araneus ventricosus]
MIIEGRGGLVRAECRHWENAARPRTFSGARTDDSPWDQDRDNRRDCQTPPSGTAAAVAVCAAPLKAVERFPSPYHLFQHLKRFLTKQHFQVTTTCVRLPYSGITLRRRISLPRCTKIGLIVRHVLQFHGFLC